MSKPKPKKEKASGNEVFLKEVGKAQMGASQMFEGAHQAMLREAGADHTERFRGRLAGDVWQQLGGSLNSTQLAAGDARKAGGYETLATSGLSAALRDGTSRGTQLKDEVTLAGANSRLANAQVSGTSLKDAARTEAKEASQKVQLANEWNNQLTGAATTLAATGIMAYGMRPKPAAGTPSIAEQQASPTLQSPYNQMARLDGRPQNINYSPVSTAATRALYGT